MDRQFLEFWGNYLLSVARGQKQLEDVTRWIRGGFSGVEELTALFKKYYGLEEQSQDSPENSAAWEKAAADFKKSFGDYFTIMGWVSKNVRTQKSLFQSQYETSADKGRWIQWDVRFYRMPSVIPRLRQDPK